MTAKFLTCIQIFGLGLSFGMSGPCFFSCAPILVVYLAAKQLKLRETLGNIFVFSAGRLLAYIILGFLTGLSASVLRYFSGAKAILFFKPLAALLIILMGILVLLGNRSNSGLCRLIQNKVSGLAGIFLLGFIIGVSPCAPLLALLFEIGLISGTVWQAAGYALCFGLGTLISGLIVIGGLAGIFSWLPLKLLNSRKANLAFRIICALILIFLGCNLYFSRNGYSG